MTYRYKKPIRFPCNKRKGNYHTNSGSFKKGHKGNLNSFNGQWKGDKVGLDGLHGWVKRRKTKSSSCELCNKITKLDLANISGKYKRDIDDYQWLCRRCHMLSDGRMKNLKRNLPISLEEKKLRQKEYAKKNREKFRIYYRNYSIKWREINREKLNAYARERYRKKNGISI